MLRTLHQAEARYLIVGGSLFSRLEQTMLKIFVAPANDVIRYEQHRLWDVGTKIWDQAPSDEVDAAWTELLSRQFLSSPLAKELGADVGITVKNVRITEEEMRKAGENLTNSVRPVDGDYVAVLAVYHQLHCLVGQKSQSSLVYSHLILHPEHSS